MTREMADTSPMAGDRPVAADLAAVAAGFGAALRQAGLPVGMGRSERFAAAARPQLLGAGRTMG